jgi:drug/metabolite transporter (DMT)-like permease
MNLRALAVFAMIGILWGSAWILTPSLPMPTMLAGSARFAIAGVLLALATLAVRTMRKPIAHAFPLVPSLVLGVTLVGLPYALAVWAKDSVSPGLVAVLYAVMPVAALLFSRNVSSASLFIPAMAIGTGGVAFLVEQGISYSSAQLEGLLLLAAAVVLGAFSLNYAKSRIKRGSFLLSSAIQCLVASVLLIFLSGTGGWQSQSSWSRTSLLAVMALALAEGAIALPFLFWLLSQLESWQAATLQWLATVIAVAEAGWFLRAKPTLPMCAGAVVVLGAIFWLLRQSGWKEGSGSLSDTVTLQITRLFQSGQDASESNEE